MTRRRVAWVILFLWSIVMPVNAVFAQRDLPKREPCRVAWSASTRCSPA